MKGKVKYAYYEWDEQVWNTYKGKVPFNYFQRPDFAEAWEQFTLYRSLIKSPMTEYAAYTNLLKVHRIAAGDIDKAIAAINQTIEIGKWTGIFEPKDYVKPRTYDLG